MKLRTLLPILFLLGGDNAYAVPIEITGAADPSIDGFWEINTVPGSYNALAGTLQSQVWFGDSGTARLFAESVGSSFGFPNGVGNRGPAFVVVNDGTLFAPTLPIQGWRYSTAGSLVGFATTGFAQQVHAIATRPTSVPEPETVPLLAIGLVVLTWVIYCG